MVMTTSDSLTASVVRILGTSADMSMPTSFMASTAAGFTVSAGADPTDRTSIWPTARWARKAAASWGRAADMSLPSAFMAATSARFAVWAGAGPAERTSIWPDQRWVWKAAAIWERRALWTQTKRTEGLGVVVMLRP